MFERPMRIRQHPAARDLVRETRLAPEDLLLPVFCEEGLTGERAIPSMPGQSRVGLDRLPAVLDRARDAGVRGILLFGVPDPDRKDEEGTPAWADDGIVARALETARDHGTDRVLAADVCLCAYTATGHCGTIDDRGRIDVDRTLPLLARTARTYARAGADWVAPSAMMDGQVQAIREALDEDDRRDTAVLAYASKFASAFYGPFRDAAESTPSRGPEGRDGYQLDPANGREALREARVDALEGADILMVKPALPYLDILWRLREATDLPLAAYHVSGEFSMIRAAADRGWLDLDRARREAHLSIRRAGADIVITYAALEAAHALREGSW